MKNIIFQKIASILYKKVYCDDTYTVGFLFPNWDNYWLMILQKSLLSKDFLLISAGGADPSASTWYVSDD